MDVETPTKEEVLEKSRFKVWLQAMRLRTLPLSLASILVGSFLALHQKIFDPLVMSMALLTTVFLQINSNLANDYGDFAQGTDNDERIGPERTMQAGLINPAQMRRAILICSALSLASGSMLLLLAPIIIWLKAVLFGLGLLAIYASITYTAGPRPYGYRGLGDASVILFFGFLGVLGAYVLQTGVLEPWVLLPSITIGAFSAGVLNVNNTRDMEADERAGKITLAVRLGPYKARLYQMFLILIGWLTMLGYGLVHFSEWLHWLFLASFPLFIVHVVKVMSISEAQKLDPLLKQLALSTFLFSLLLGVGILLS